MSDRPLRIAIDARCLNVDHLRGMGKMVYELVKRTADSGAVQWHLLSNRPDLPIHVPDERGCDVSVFETPGHRLNAWEQWSLPRQARRLAVDLLHSPAISMPWWQPVRSVVTIHDTIPWRHQDSYWKAGFYLDRLLPAAYRKATAIMTISESSRRDILAKWPALRRKLHVVPLGVDERYFEAQLSYRPIEIAGRVVREPYLLYLGGTDPRKRLTWALQTWWGASSDLSLVVCGVEPHEHDSVRQIVPRQLQDRLYLAPFVSESEMPHLYMRAAAVLYPSLYEGFGLPVVEAQAVGTPILFSDVGSLTELKGPGAVVLPVDDMAAWVRTVNNIVQAPERLTGPDRVARAWARQYSWDAYIDRTLAVYASVVERQAVRGNHDHHLSEGVRP
jgi:alpha-1,3-rhamnosyl/mannosyltransferase